MSYVNETLNTVKLRNPGELEFHQAVEEVLESLEVFLEKNPVYREECVLERLVEPERVISFRVPWMDDRNRIQINRGYRVEFNSALGPFTGGVRFHPSVNLGILKFLAFEQVFKNALTTLPMGAAKGGADFDPKGRSRPEIMRFCQSFMTELSRHLGPDTDILTTDLGVGPREIGYLFGQYKRTRNEYTGVATGKGIAWGGSHIRPEATGYGLAYFVEAMLTARGDGIAGKTCILSGSGNVAVYTAEKLVQLGARVLTLSDSQGFVHAPDGLTKEHVEALKNEKLVQRGDLKEWAEKRGLRFYDGQKPWSVSAFAVFPCAIQNEIDGLDADTIVRNEVKLVAEGSNMPCVPEAVHKFLKRGLLVAPGKAANAGGIAACGLEMMQNSQRFLWDKTEVDERLRTIMHRIHDETRAAAERGGQPDNYVLGANVAAFRMVADAMLDQGLV